MKIKQQEKTVLAALRIDKIKKIIITMMINGIYDSGEIQED